MNAPRWDPLDTNARRLFYVIIFFLLGIFTHSVWYSMNFSKYSMLMVILGMIFLSFLIPRYHRVLPIVLVSGVALLIGVLRFHIAIPNADESMSSLKQLQSNGFSGWVTTEPEHQEYRQRFVVADKKTKILVTTDSFTDVSYGDYVEVKGSTTLTKSFVDKRGRTVHYERTLAGRGITYVVSYAQLTKSETPPVMSLEMKLVKKLYSLKNNLIKNSHRLIPEPESGLLAGILFGKIDALSPDFEESFRKVGLMHIVVLSGYNVAIVIQAFISIFRFFSRRWQSLLALFGVVLFAILVGGGPTVVRASVMAGILLFARYLGRQYDVWRAILFALVVLVIINPYILVYNLSFQLSFLATVGVIAWHPIFLWYFKSIPNIFELRDSLATTLSAQVMVTPLILYTIGDFSFIAPLVNAVCLFAVPPAMLLGFFASLPFVSNLFSYLAYLPLHYIIVIVDWGNSIPHTMVSLPRFSWLALVVLYMLIAFWYRYTHAQLLTYTMKI